jgi:hypothetical protein
MSCICPATAAKVVMKNEPPACHTTTITTTFLATMITSTFLATTTMTTESISQS